MIYFNFEFVVAQDQQIHIDALINLGFPSQYVRREGMAYELIGIHALDSNGDIRDHEFIEQLYEFMLPGEPYQFSVLYTGDEQNKLVTMMGGMVYEMIPALHIFFQGYTYTVDNDGDLSHFNYDLNYQDDGMFIPQVSFPPLIIGNDELINWMQNGDLNFDEDELPLLTPEITATDLMVGRAKEWFARCN